MSLFKLRNLENPAYPLTSNALLKALGHGLSTESGVTVTETSGLRMSAVYRATTLISSLGGALPLQVYATGTKDRVVSRLLDNVHPEMTNYEFWKLSYVHRCLWGNSYAQKIYDGMNRVQWLYPIYPDRVRVGRAKPIELNPSGKVFEVTDDDGVVHALTNREILHIPGLSYDGYCGISPVRAAAQAIGLSLAAEKGAARLFGSGNMLSGLIQTDARVNQEDAETLQLKWTQKFGGADNAYAVGVLDSGAQFQSLTMPSSDAQMLESRDFQVTELARYFGVPLYLMMEAERSTSWGTGLEQQATGFVTFDLSPSWLVPTEARITKELLGATKYAKYNVTGLLRGDAQARADYYRTMRELGVYSADDINELEDRPPIGGPEGDLRLQPMNMVPLGTLPPEPQPVAAGGAGGPKDGDGDGLIDEPK